jgi:hypothetical protein
MTLDSAAAGIDAPEVIVTLPADPVQVFECSDLLHLITSFQDGVRAKDYTNINRAAACGHLGLLPTILQNKAYGITKGAQDHAATLDVLKFLEAHTEEGCTSNALITAVRADRMDLVTHHLHQREEGCLWEAMDAAAAAGNVGMLSYLHTQSLQLGGETAQLTSRARVDAAAANGHIDVLNFLAEHRSGLESCTHRAVDGAAANGHLKALMWLRQHTGELIQILSTSFYMYI